MRALGYPFEQINTEQLVQQIYRRGRTIHEARQENPTVQLTCSQWQFFSVSVRQPRTHGIRVPVRRWSIRESSLQLALSGAELGHG